MTHLGSLLIISFALNCSHEMKPLAYLKEISIVCNCQLANVVCDARISQLIFNSVSIHKDIGSSHLLNGFFLCYM